MIYLHCLPALYGDCFLVRSSDEKFSFLIDCGYKRTYFNEIKKLTRNVDFVILTHVDEDHILGAFPLIEDAPEKFSVGKIYINTPGLFEAATKSGDISVRQAIVLEKMLNDKGIPQFELKQGSKVEVSENCDLSVISPSTAELDSLERLFHEHKRDSAKYTPISLSGADLDSVDDLSKKKDSFKSKKADVINASSIAFVLSYKTKKVLFLGDSHPVVITEYLRSLGYDENNKMIVDYVKLSHHGSISSISLELISIICCSRYIISTIGGRSNNKHPSREALCKLAVHVDRGIEEYISFFFNYPVEQYEHRNGKIFTDEEMAEYKINMIYKNTLVLE